MKVISRTLVIPVILFFAACKKEQTTEYSPARTIKFLLYTTKDFSADTQVITFRLNIRNKGKTLFDSALAPMKIKDIPTAANKLTYQKTVNDASDLAVGFRYSINDVGNSWYTDTCSAGESFKVVDYDFR